MVVWRDKPVSIRLSALEVWEGGWRLVEPLLFVIERENWVLEVLRYKTREGRLRIRSGTAQIVSRYHVIIIWC